ncbi:MAG: radical SAM peptide maturase [bacterium]|nr:radical SAM peptide maturase [bacterium]
MKQLRITSAGGNNYLLSKAIPQTLLLHPAMNHLLELEEKNTNLENYLDSIPENEKIEIEPGLQMTGDELRYYYSFYLLLQKNGYFNETKKYPMTGKEYNAESIKYHLANTSQVVFEVCDSCNLNCRYCAYGELYSGYDKRENKRMDTATAKKILDYMANLFQSDLHRKFKKRVMVSFYGGEPLLCMPFIKEIVNYVETSGKLQKKFGFSMTTNGVLLDRHMDFLAKHNFSLLISLDGNEAHNGHRVFHDGSSSFKKIYGNILALKEKYPAYYEKHVMFNAVIHNLNSGKNCKEFFKQHLGKEPMLSEVSDLGLDPAKRTEFDTIQKNPLKGFDVETFKEEVRDKKRILNTPFVSPLHHFFLKYGGFTFRRYDMLVREQETADRVITGTCRPFSRKIFITTNGRILPCERIEQKYTMGKVDETGVHLDFNEVADLYNSYLDTMKRKCNSCFNANDCSYCIFRSDLFSDTPHCPEFKSEEQHRTELARQLSILEDVPQYYHEIMTNYAEN